MMAIPSGLNPILATNLPLSLSAPRGANVAVDALRLSLLGVGAIHQAFLFAKKAKGHNDFDQTSSMLERARTLRQAAKVMLVAASQDSATSDHDAAIAAGATNALIDVSRRGLAALYDRLLTDRADLFRRDRMGRQLRVGQRPRTEVRDTSYFRTELS